MSIKKNVFYNFIKTLSTIVFPLITFPYISRTLLPDNIGKVNFGLSFISYFSLIASLGITTYAIRECAKVRTNSIKLNSIASQIYTINILTTIIAYVFLIISIMSFSELESYRMIIIVQSFSIIVTTLGTDWINSALEDYRFITYRTVLFQVISLALIFLLVHKPDDYMKYIVITLVSSCGASLTNIMYRKKYCEIKFICNFIQGIDWKYHLPPIIFLFVMLLSQTIFNSVDHTMLGLICGDYEVGIYSTACKISNLISQMVASILWVIIPRLSFYFSEKNYLEINRLLRKVLGVYLLFGIPCAVGCFYLSDDIIMLIAGESFIKSSPVLKILMIGFIVSLFGGNFLGNAVLLSSGREKYYMKVCLVTAFVNVIANCIFIPEFGEIGAAATTTICSFVILLLLLCNLDHRIKIENKYNLLVSPIIGTFFIIAICFFCKDIINIYIRFFSTVLLSTVAYSFILIITKNEFALMAFDSLKRKLK